MPFKKLITNNLCQLILIFLVLISFRFYFTGGLKLGFLVWNLFLAVCPNIIVWGINRFKLNKAFYSLWLLFFPNSIYVLTDMIHIYAYPNRPINYWYDVIMILSLFAIGIVAAFSSFKQVYSKFFGYKVNIFAIFGIWWITFFGVYIGRELRFNSWDILTPHILIRDLQGMTFRIEDFLPFVIVWPICVSWWFILWLRTNREFVLS